jgi:hypothetical protein
MCIEKVRIPAEARSGAAGREQRHGGPGRARRKRATGLRGVKTRRSLVEPAPDAAGRRRPGGFRHKPSERGIGLRGLKVGARASARDTRMGSSKHPKRTGRSGAAAKGQSDEDPAASDRRRSRCAIELSLERGSVPQRHLDAMIARAPLVYHWPSWGDAPQPQQRRAATHSQPGHAPPASHANEGSA